MLIGSRSRRAWVVAVWLSVLLPAALLARQRKLEDYRSPAVYDGLYYCGTDEYDPRALVLSWDGSPVTPKANEPDAPTKPGFYLSYEEPYEFDVIKVVRRSVYFRTRARGGVSYIFVGTAGWRINDMVEPSDVPFIKGTLTQCKNGRALKKEKVEFSHAVVL